ncbi:MAG: tetratricopeptide repeat protein [Candidatus Omnitrophota bacterium]|nr:MAG: tetratricopeptide repeat protein [Candidatus Omnitrophota bacterium]
MGKLDKNYIYFVLIIIVGFGVYCNSLGGPFIWDDHHLVKNNVYIKRWSNVPKIFAEDIAAGAAGKFHYYRPLQIITYAFDYSFWRLNVIGYHLTNILLHIGAALLIYWLISLLFGDRILAFLTSIFFVIHPIHTEAVAYISGRADCLVAVFILLCCVFYIKYLEKSNIVFYLCMICCYMLALLSRENSLILPVILALYHYTFKKKIKLESFMSVVGLTFIFILLRLTALKFLLPPASSSTTVIQRVPGFFVALTNYLKLLFVPFSLHMEYENTLFAFTAPKAIVGIFLCLLLLIYAFKMRNKNRLIFFSISWFFVMLLPQSNLFYPLTAYMAEHWLYLASIGFFLILAKTITYLYKNKNFKIPTIVITIVLSMFYFYVTMRQNIYWAKPTTLFERTVKYAPHSYVAYTALGLTYHAEGKRQDAISAFKKAIEINPNYAEPYLNLGFLYIELGQTQEAIRSFKKAIENNPEYPEAYNNLGLVYHQIGKRKESVLLYKKAIDIFPYYARSYNNLGLIYEEEGNRNDAIASFRKAIEVDPDFSDAHNNLGVLLYKDGQKEEAAGLVKKAIKIDPENAAAYGNLALMYFMEGQYPLALKYYDSAQRLGFVNPDLSQKLKPYRQTE